MSNDIKLLNQELEKIENVLHGLELVEPPATLLPAVLNSINRRRAFIRIARLAALGAAAASFAVYFIFSWSAITEQFVQSETLKIASIFFYDFSLAQVHWKDFALYFLESLPAAPILLILSGVFLAMLSLKIITQELRHKTFLISHK